MEQPTLDDCEKVSAALELAHKICRDAHHASKDPVVSWLAVRIASGLMDKSSHTTAAQMNRDDVVEKHLRSVFESLTTKA